MRQFVHENSSEVGIKADSLRLLGNQHGFRNWLENLLEFCLNHISEHDLLGTLVFPDARVVRQIERDGLNALAGITSRVDQVDDRDWRSKRAVEVLVLFGDREGCFETRQVRSECCQLFARSRVFETQE